MKKNDTSPSGPEHAPSLAILILLVIFPQLSETIYAPVLPQIATAFAVTQGQAQWTMSIYFAGFALGVLFWGRMADHFGRRPALLGGLCCYGGSALLALLAGDFTTLLLARALLAFGASVGSIVVQTMLRDRYHGTELTAIFSTVVAALALSPALGPPLGSLLAASCGHNGVFAGLCALAVVLLLCGASLPETRPPRTAATVPLLQVTRRLLGDRRIWASAWLVAGFNLILFGYYTVAPFTLQQLGMPAWLFGASGVLIALIGLGGARLNRYGLPRYGPACMIAGAASINVAAALAQWCALAWSSSYPRLAAAGLLGTQLLMVLAFSCAIPNILATALQDYRAIQGSAGAVFGLLYYVLIAAGLGLLGAAYHGQLWAQPLFMLAVSMAIWPVARRLHRVG